MGGNKQLIVRIPPAAYDSLAGEAEKKGTTIQAIVLKLIGRHTKVKIPKPRRGRPKTRSA